MDRCRRARRSRRRATSLAGLTTLLTAVALGALLSSGAAAGVDVTGTWHCCGAGGAAQQTLVIIGGTGAIAGRDEEPNGSVFATLSGSVSGQNVRIVTTYTAIEPGYMGTFVGTVAADGGTMSGTWTSNAGQSGTWTATLASAPPAGAPPPPPLLFTAEDAAPVSGTVLIKLPPGAQASASATTGQGFSVLTQARRIPVGSILDTSAGTVALTAAGTRAGQRSTGQFTGGVFALLQNRAQRGLTQLTIMDTLGRAAVCATTGKGAAARKTLPATVLGRLKSTDHGRFATRGRYSSATVRGTQYAVADTCAGTLTTVTRGSVVVDDFRRHRTVVVRAGQSFLAKASGAPSTVVPIGR